MHLTSLHPLWSRDRKSGMVASRADHSPVVVSVLSSEFQFHPQAPRVHLCPHRLDRKKILKREINLELGRGGGGVMNGLILANVQWV